MLPASSTPASKRRLIATAAAPDLYFVTGKLSVARCTLVRCNNFPAWCSGVPLVMASAPGMHAQLLHNMCQRRYWDTLDIRQYLTRIDKSPRLRLEPSEGARSACLAL